MYKSSMICIHAISLIALVAASTYIYLNETGKLKKIKRECESKVMELKEEIKEKLN